MNMREVAAAQCVVYIAPRNLCSHFQGHRRHTQNLARHHRSPSPMGICTYLGISQCMEELEDVGQTAETEATLVATAVVAVAVMDWAVQVHGSCHQ